jgi:hypothetical protein
MDSEAEQLASLIPEQLLCSRQASVCHAWFGALSSLSPDASHLRQLLIDDRLPNLHDNRVYCWATWWSRAVSGLTFFLKSDVTQSIVQEALEENNTDGWRKALEECNDVVDYSVLHVDGFIRTVGKLSNHSSEILGTLQRLASNEAFVLCRDNREQEGGRLLLIEIQVISLHYLGHKKWTRARRGFLNEKIGELKDAEKAADDLERVAQMVLET